MRRELFAACLVAIGTGTGCHGATTSSSGEAIDQGGWIPLAQGGACQNLSIPADDAGGIGSCVVLETLPSWETGTAQSVCTSGASPGLSAPDPGVLEGLQYAESQAWRAGGMVGPDPQTLPTCQVNALTGNALSNGTCTGASEGGWCYVTGSAAGSCAAAIQFATGTVPGGASVYLQCNVVP